MTPLERAARAAFDEIERQAASLAPEHSGNGYVMPDEFGNRSYYACIDHNIDLMAVARAVLMAAIPQEIISDIENVVISLNDANDSAEAGKAVLVFEPGCRLMKRVERLNEWSGEIDAILASGGE